MIHFPLLDYILWTLSFILASIVSWLFFSRHHIWLAWFVPFWLATGNLAEFLASLFGLHSYAWVYYPAQMSLVALEAAFGLHIGGVILRDDSRPVRAYGVIVAIVIAIRHYDLILFVPRIMDTELYLAGGIGLLMIVAYMSRQIEPDEPYGWLGAGLALMLMGQVLGAGLIHCFGSAHWALTSRVQPLGELLGLAVLGWAGLGKAPEHWVIRLPFEKPKSLMIVGEA